MKILKKNIKNKYLILILLLIVLILGINILLTHQNNHNQSTITHSKTTALNNNQQNIKTVALPKPPISCSTNISLVALSSDYIITGMNCYPSNTQSNSTAPLSCDGTIFHGSVSVNCFRPEQYSYKNQLVCSGSLNPQLNPTNLTLSYNCSLPNSNTNSILYSCNGDISNFSYSAISLPLTVNCNS